MEIQKNRGAKIDPTLYSILSTLRGVVACGKNRENWSIDYRLFELSSEKSTAVI